VVSVIVLDTDVASALLRRRAPEALARSLRDLPLATFNIKDFTDFVEHEGLQILPTQ
jgi:hypothetical protein